MAAPSLAILKFHCRTDTYLRGKKTQKNWIKAEERAFRSYLKLVCKEGLYSHLVPYTWQGYNGYERQQYFRPYNGYTHGYPSWFAPRCYLRDQWYRAFTDHRTAVEKAERARELKEWNDRYEGHLRVFQLRNGKKSRLLDLAKATHAIKSHVSRQHV